MRKKLGGVCMIAGAALLLGALSLFLWNRAEDDRAERSSMAVLPLINEAIAYPENPADSVSPEEPETSLPPEKKEMTEVEINGNRYIGYLSIPSKELELPIMSQWSYPKLKIAPCRYSGTTMDNNLVLIAHNYRSHFGPVHQLRVGDEVFFTDMDGVTIAYRVVAVDVVPPASAQEVSAGNSDLALVTCTYGGKTRLVVYCDAATATD